MIRNSGTHSGGEGKEWNKSCSYQDVHHAREINVEGGGGKSAASCKVYKQQCYSKYRLTSTDEDTHYKHGEGNSYK